jgi:predicted DNA-binding protein YlxM (UPF0122 family)
MASKKTGRKVGRPTVMTDETRRKIEEAAALDASVEEICYYANISRDTYYTWIKKDPEFSDRIEKLRQRPILKARQTVVNSLDTPAHAFEYLKKKRKAEFGDESKLDITGTVNIQFDNAFASASENYSK